MNSEYVVENGILVSCSAFNAVIPEEVKGIATRAFDKNVLSVEISDGVEKIEKGAFEKCKKLTRIRGREKHILAAVADLPKAKFAVEITSGSISPKAFAHCENITSVIIEDAVEKVGAKAFSSCLFLTYAKVGRGIKTLANWLFSSCFDLEKVELSDGLKVLGDGVFAYCNSITELSLPDSVTSIGKEAFRETCLRSFAVPSKVTVIREYTFFACRLLRELYLPSDLKRFDMCAFSGCKALTTTITVPPTMCKIPSGAFSDCKSIKNIVIPPAVKEIGHGAFKGCDALKKIVIPDGVTKIDGSVFSDCKGLKTVVLPRGIKEISPSLFSGSGLSSIRIPDGVTTIGGSAFSNCKKLKSISLPDSVTEISAYAFRGCALTSFEIPKKVTSLESDVFYESQIEEIVVPEHVERICEGAFSECYRLKKVEILNGVKEIRANAFYRCVELVEVKISASVKKIGDDAFSNCDRLQTVIIDGVLDHLGYSAFALCPSLERLEIKKPLSFGRNVFKFSVIAPTWYFSQTDDDERVFYISNYLEIDRKYWDNQKVIEGYAKRYKMRILNNLVENDNAIGFSYLTKITDFLLGAVDEALARSADSSAIRAALLEYKNSRFSKEEVEKHEDEKAEKAFGMKEYTRRDWSTTFTLGYNDTGYTVKEYLAKTSPLIVPERIEGKAVTKIGAAVFKENNDLYEIVLPDSVTEIEETAFYCCFNLEITMPKKLKKVGACAFNQSAIKEVVLPEIKEVGEYAFADCEGLTKVVIDGSAVLADYAFSFCVNLSEITLSKKIKKIGPYAFAYCKNLKTVRFDGTVEEWNAIKKITNSFRESPCVVYCADGEIEL